MKTKKFLSIILILTLLFSIKFSTTTFADTNGGMEAVCEIQTGGIGVTVINRTGRSTTVKWVLKGYDSSGNLKQNFTKTWYNLRDRNTTHVYCIDATKAVLETTYTINGVSTTFTSTFTRASSISLNTTHLNLVVGQTANLSASLSPSTGQYNKVEWSTSNRAVARATTNYDVYLQAEHEGTITAVSPGTAVITGFPIDGSGLFQTCIVTVTN